MTPFIAPNSDERYRTLPGGSGATLPPQARLCVVLAYSEGMSHAEISDATAIPLGTAKSHIARGATRLRARG